MKKNKALRLASVLMMACLLTTCVISGTFAKYVTSKEGSDTAHVAKWGVTITPNAEFESEYATDDVSVVGTIAKSVIKTDGNVVAPGTEGKMMSIDLAGTPEVAVAVTYDAELTLADWMVDGTYYCPIVIKVGDVSFAGTSYSNAAAFEDAVEKEIEDNYKGNYAPGTNLDTDASVKKPAITWSWAFRTGASDAEKAENDEKDTKLGDAATAATITLSITTTLTQID